MTITAQDINDAAVAVFRQRAERINKLRTMKPEAKAQRVAELRVFYKDAEDGAARFVNDWGVTFDPRLAEIGLPAVIPFTLWTRQWEFLVWLQNRWRNREDGVCEKSRDCGASWLCVGFAVWGWSFSPGFIAGFGSRKEEYVDNSSDPKSLFWKVRSFIEWMPIELRPSGFDMGKHAPYMRIENPEIGSMIVGEAGDNIGRGNRTSIYFKDESAFYDRPDVVDRALSQTANCKIDVSTPNGPGGPFYRKAHGGRIPKFTFHWKSDPRKDQAWYDKQVATADDPVIVAQELDIDYNASTTDSYISGASVQVAQNKPPSEVRAHGAWIIGIDAAHFGNDTSTIYARKGLLTLPPKRMQGADGTMLAGAVLEMARQLEASMPGSRVGALVVELDGPGVSCFDIMRQDTTYRERAVGVHTGARVSNGKDYNLKAELWRSGKVYLNTEGATPSMPSVDEDGKPIEIKSQIGSYRYSFRDGVLLMEKKAEYKKRIGKSPDDADGWMLTHIPSRLIPVVQEPMIIPPMASAWRRK